MAEYSIPESVRFQGAGVELTADCWGEAAAPPVLLLHGGGQTRAAWTQTAQRLSIEQLFSAVVLVDITPRMEPEGVERIVGFMLGHPNGFASLADASEAIAVYRPNRPRPTDHSGLERILRQTSDGGEFVYQSYRKTPFFQREVVLAISSEPIPDGRRFSWRKASDQSALTGTRIEIDRTENLWEVTGSAEHCHVVLELSFAPGGNVPAFLIDWLQGAGVKDQLGELRRYASSRSNNSENPNRTR